MNTQLSTPFAQSELDRLCINTIRFLPVDAVQHANSGHPGLPMGAAPMAYVLWTRFLKHHPANPQWFDRDRFILSAGHGSMLLYSLLYLTGYGLLLEQITQFQQWRSMTPGHPERGLAPGVETTTGPLGQGFGNGVGLAMAEAHLAAQYNRPGFELINHFTYGLVSDGDLMEGVASEAASLAGHLQLGKLIYLYDDNRISLAAAFACMSHPPAHPTTDPHPLLCLDASEPVVQGSSGPTLVGEGRQGRSLSRPLSIVAHPANMTVHLPLGFHLLPPKFFHTRDGHPPPTSASLRPALRL